MADKKTKLPLAICISAVFVNLALFFIKLHIGLATGSLCIYTDAMNNLLDTLTCIMGAVGFFVLKKPRNSRYPFGFGRAEELVSLAMSAAILLTGSAFAYSSLERLLYPTPVSFTPKYAVLLALTAFVKLLMAFVCSFFRKKYPSAILDDMQLDSTLDFFISLATIFSFTLSAYIGLSTDGLMGLVISILILIGGVKILLPAVAVLMGRRDDAFCEKAQTYLASFAEIESVPELECHSYGKKRIVVAKVFLLEGRYDVLPEITERFQQEFSAELVIAVQKTIG